jgi:hypothetical protein
MGGTLGVGGLLSARSAPDGGPRNIVECPAQAVDELGDLRLRDDEGRGDVDRVPA